ncbi:hypothetical protein B0H17DRAFT_951902, partial [Mycena rosella]
LRSGARNAHSDDTKNVREAIVPWLNILFPKMDPPLDPDSRDNRGLYHDDTGRLLCPIDYDWDDEEVRTAIREGDSEYPVTADSWFRGLYPPDGFDPEQPEVGLFKNVVLLKVFKFIFTSPLSVKTMPKGVDRENVGSMSKRNVAAIIGLKAVTGCSIGYAAVQISQYRVALSDANHWDESDGAFDHITFYNNIVEYFEFPPGPRACADVNRLLDFWNTYVICARHRDLP